MLARPVKFANPPPHDKWTSFAQILRNHKRSFAKGSPNDFANEIEIDILTKLSS